MVSWNKWNIYWNKCSIAGMEGRGKKGEPSFFMGKEKNSTFKGMGLPELRTTFHFYCYSKWFELKLIFSDLFHPVGLDFWLVAGHLWNMGNAECRAAGAEVVGTWKGWEK